MNINEEIEVKQRKVDLLKREIEEIGLRDKLANENTHIIDESGCVKSQALLEKQSGEIKCLRDMYDGVCGRLHDREAEISRLEKSNCEFHETIVKLHTEIQDKDGCINELEIALRSPILLDIINLVSAWLTSDKRPIGTLETLSKIAGILDIYNRLLEAKHSSTAVPDGVVSAVKKIQEIVNENLPDGIEAKVIAQQVTPKQMTEMLNITRED